MDWNQFQSFTESASGFCDDEVRYCSSVVGRQRQGGNNDDQIIKVRKDFTITGGEGPY